MTKQHTTLSDEEEPKQHMKLPDPPEKGERIYWFRRGEEDNYEYFDFPRKKAREIWDKIRNRHRDYYDMEYVGWSDGRFMDMDVLRQTWSHEHEDDNKEWRQKGPREEREKVLECINKEIDFAINNDDMSPPPQTNRAYIPSSSNPKPPPGLLQNIQSRL